MRFIDRIRMRLRSLLRRSQVERELDAELQFHMEQQVEEVLASGMPPEAACCAARRKFGNVALVKEETRDTWGFRFFDILWRDLCFAAKSLSKARGFTAVAVLSLAVGIGVNTAVFSVVDTALLRALPYPGSGRLFAIYEIPPDQPDGKRGAAVGNFAAWYEQNEVFESFGGAAFLSRIANSPDNPEVLSGMRVSLGYLPALQVQPLLGRWFTPEDYRPDSPLPVILSYACWQRRFGGDPDVLGKTILLESLHYVVVGVMPPDFAPIAGRGLFRDAQFWVAWRFTPDNLGSATRYVSVIGRMKPGVSEEQAHAALTVLAGRMQQEFPERNKGWGIGLEPLHQAVTSRDRGSLLTLWAAVGMVLLIACANVAGLSLGKASARGREIAIRASLGAGRLRIARQLLTESVLLALVGGAVGLLVAYGALEIVAAASETPQLSEVSMDARVLGYTLLLSIVTGILFGLAPVTRVSRLSPGEALKDGGRGAGAGSAKQTFRKALVVVQVAVALVLMIGSGLLINSLLRLTGVDSGFDTKNLLSFEVRLPTTQRMYVQDSGTLEGFSMKRVGPDVAPLFARLLDDIRRAPGVEAAVLCDAPPTGGWPWQRPIRIHGRSEPVQGDATPPAGYHPISADFFSTLGVPLIRGRSISETDVYSAPWTAVINEEAARRYWPDSDPIGDLVTFDALGDEQPRRIVGVVANIRHTALHEPIAPEIYVSHLQQSLYMRGNIAYSRLYRTFVVRTKLDIASLLPSLQEVVSGHTGNQPIAGAGMLDDWRDDQLAGRRFAAMLLSAFGAVAMILAAVGLFALMAYTVILRTREIGLRMALGAQRRDVVGMFLRQALALGATGVVVGLLLSYGLTRLIASRLYEITPTDPATFALVSLCLLALMGIASFVPAWRATRVNPTESLRAD
jgi:putative ABC transport system permease protein